MPRSKWKRTANQVGMKHCSRELVREGVTEASFHHRPLSNNLPNHSHSVLQNLSVAFDACQALQLLTAESLSTQFDDFMKVLGECRCVGDVIHDLGRRHGENIQEYVPRWMEHSFQTIRMFGWPNEPVTIMAKVGALYTASWPQVLTFVRLGEGRRMHPAAAKFVDRQPSKHF